MVTHYASTVHGQPNANASDAKLRNEWVSNQKACAVDVTKAPQGSTSSLFEVKGKDFKRPWTFTAIQYGFDIPECAYINSVKFEVRVKIDTKSKIPSPYAHFNLYHGKNTVKDNIKDYNGWKDGLFNQAADKKYLSTSWQTLTYVMSGAEFRKKGYPISELNELRMGIDLRFFKPESLKGATKIDIQWVRCTVDYQMPNHVVTFDTVTSETSPRHVYCGEVYDVTVKHQNRSNAGCCNGNTRDLTVTLPPNAKIISSNGNYSNGVWTVACTPNSESVLKLKLKDYSMGVQKINIQGSDVGNYDYWINNSHTGKDVGEVTGYPSVMQLNTPSCITFDAVVDSYYGAVDFYIDLVTLNKAVDSEHTPSSVDWSIDEDKSTEGVRITNVDGNHIQMSVPAQQVVNIVFKGCFKPDFIGSREAMVKLDYDGTPTWISYNVIDAPDYIVRNTGLTTDYDRDVGEIIVNPSTIRFRTHRLATSTEIEAYVIDCSYAEANMITEEPTLSANIWEKLDYIGVVPLEYHHYDPDSTYSNKAISDAYKNKTYKGKEGVIDEKISLKFKCRPKQAPTLQGLVELDKPTPINANHKCFESDPLNHRGWAVLSEVKFTRTNPLWYDCEAEVDYITHDIYTKFEIFTGEKVNTQDMPSMMAETFSLGENLSTGLDLFTVDTDGGFIYDDDGEDGAKNIFSLDEGQHLSIATRNPLANVSQIRFDWYSNKIAEDRENNLERIFRIRNANGDSVLEYEYTDFKFYEGYITCNVIVRVLNDGGSWVPHTYPIDIRTELEAEPITDSDNDDAEEVIIDIDSSDVEDDEEEDIDEETPYEEGYIAPTFDSTQYDLTTMYGSSLEIILNGNKVSIYDSGYSGRELAIENEELVPSTSYTFESVWTNKNSDGMTEDIISYIDVSLAETILSNEFAEYYSSLRVSPFPIPYKTVAFTRESEEGTLFYLQGENPFKYRIEPYYQYHCGCDLLGEEISIFNLNNSYTHYSIENGLVRLGFNKYNGRLSLAKWDVVSKEWITTHYFHMSEDTKFELEGKLSDDKITIRAGTDTFFTIWRGRPWIGVKNPNDEIFIDSKFNYCLSDKVDGVPYEYPVVYSFLNTHNLLPSCIGGKRLDYDCFLLDDDQISTGTDHTLTITANTESDTFETGTEITFNASLSPSTTDGDVHYLINGEDKGTVEHPFSFTYTFDTAGAYEIQAVFTGDDDDNPAFSSKIVLKVENPEIAQNSEFHNKPQDSLEGKYNLSFASIPSKFTYRDNKEVVLILTKGGKGVKGYPIECVLPDGRTETLNTNAAGKVSYKNTNAKVGKVQWGGRFYDLIHSGATLTNGKLIDSALKWVEVGKATPSFTTNASSNKLNKGKKLVIQLNGVGEKLNNEKITYTIGKGSKKSKTTNKNGKISIAFNEKGTYPIKLMFAGNKNYKSISKKFTLQVK